MGRDGIGVGVWSMGGEVNVLIFELLGHGIEVYLFFWVGGMVFGKWVF